VQTIEQPLTLFDQHLNGLPAVPVAAQQHQSVRMRVCKHKLCPHGRGGRRCSTLRCRCPRPGAVNRPRMPRSTARARRRRCICCRHSPLKRLFPLKRVVSAARLVLLDVLLLLWRQDTWVKPHQGNRRWRGKLCAVPRMVHACASSPGMTSASSASEGTRRSLFPRLTACADIHLHSPTRSRGRAECILRSRRARRYVQVSPSARKQNIPRRSQFSRRIFQSLSRSQALRRPSQRSCAARAHFITFLGLGATVATACLQRGRGVRSK
jgi:hypothetical protein